MKKFIITFLLILIGNQTVVFSQESTPIYYQKVLKERIFVHYNTSFALSGESLLYKVYCIRDRTNQLSTLSKVAYIELIDARGKRVFKNKLRLDNGVSNGSFNIPNTTASGNYKLIAYTEWMRNEGTDYFFKGTISIINTIQKNQGFNVKSTVKSKMPIVASSQANSTLNDIKEVKDQFKLVLKQQEYAKRQKVQLNVEGLDKSALLGNYSVSVRKVNTFKKGVKPTSKTYVFNYPNNTIAPKSKAHFLPEFKGDLLKGIVLHKETGIPVSNVRIALSVPNKKFKFRFATTDKKGVFEFMFKTAHEDSEAVVQILDVKKEMYKLVMVDQESLKYEGLTFNEIEITPKGKEELLAYNIQNQIEKSYATSKQKTKLKTLTDDLFNKSSTYLLDDYNRFATVKETVIEIVKSVRIINRNGKYKFFVRNSDRFDEVKELPLVIMDGVFIQNHDEIMDFNASKVKSISVVREKYVYESYIFQGIIFIETFKGDYKNDEISDYMKNVQFDVPSNNNGFYKQQYLDASFDRIPDYRRQLAWLPMLNLQAEENKVDFYTSDIVGDFEISLEGFTQKGIPVSLKEFFSVK